MVMKTHDGGNSVGTLSLVYSDVLPEKVFGLTAAHNLCDDVEGRTVLFRDAYVLLEKNDPNIPR